MIKNIQFRYTKNSFQQQLRKDIKELYQNKNMSVSVGKSTSIYKMEKGEYENLLFENVTKTYMKTTEQKLKTINKDAPKFAEKFELDDGIKIMKKG